MNERGPLPGGVPQAPEARSRRTVLAVAATVAAWVVTRGLVLWLYLDRHSWVTGDIDYFARSLAAVPDEGLARTLVEYPLPGVLVVALPWLLVTMLDAPEAYAEAVLVLSMAADAAFLFLLARFGGAGRRAAVVVWLLAVPLLGATAYARFDLVPGVLAGTALLLLPVHPRAAAGAGALATGFKLWPALVLPALAAPAATRRAVLTVVGLVGGVLAVASLVVAGWGRLVSPLTWQSERGLQIESVAATPAMVGWAAFPDRYMVVFTQHNAFEVLGPATGLLVRLSEAAMLMLAAALVWLWAAAWRRGQAVSARSVAWLALAAVSAFVVTSKVLSPQYLLWLLPLAAAATAVAGSVALRAWTALLLVATAATQVVFPELYSYVVAPGDLTGVAVLVLATRNLLLVALTAWAGVMAVRTLRSDAAGDLSGGGRSSASPPAPRGTTAAASGDGPTTRR